MYTKVILLFAAVQCVLCRPIHDDHHSVPYYGPLAKPVVLKSGYLADTHEVAAARSAHQAALEKESYYHRNSEGHEEYRHDDHHSVPYHGPLAKPVVLKSGYLADTQEVAAARSAHQAALEKESYNHGYSEGHEVYSHDDHHYVPYHRPLAKPVVLKSGYLADTQEVAAARIAHQAALEKESYHHGSSESNKEYRYDDHHSVPYHGPLAKPVVLKSGFLADTQEVASAKQHHLQALHSDGHDLYYDGHY